MNRAVNCLVSALVLATAACGSTVSSNDGAGPSGDGGADSAVAPTDGGTITPGMDAGAVLPERAGTVTISAINASIAGRDFSATNVAAGFSQTFGGQVNSMCVARTVAGCQVISCSRGGDAGVAGDGGAGGGAVSAGNLTITGGMGMPIVIMPGMNNAYTFNEMGQRFMAGTGITVRASGDPMGVPMFAGMVTFPSAVSVTAPLLNPLMPLPVPRAMPLALSWTGGTAGSVRVFIATGSTGAGGDSVNCIFPAMSGSATLSPEVLGALPAGRGVLAIAAANTTDVMAGDYRVSVIATNSNSLPGGQIDLQ